MNVDRFKFRIWCNTSKYYIDNVPDIISETGDMPTHEIIEPGRDCILEQCTGLKDKNGKLIFEGDKIQTPISKQNKIWKSIKYICTKAAFCMANSDDIKNDGIYDIWQPITVDWLTEFEAYIIGNIHDKESNK